MRSVLGTFLILSFVMTPSARALATPNYHLVGWVNTFVPGGGALLLDEPGQAAVQATIEVGTFLGGFSLSSKSPMTLDGVPENIPARGSNGTNNPQDITPALQADFLQEIGLKYHMVNVFDSYRRASLSTGVGALSGQGIDDTSVRDLFLAPFQPDVLSSPWVYLGIVASLAGHIYTSSTQGTTASAPLTARSNWQYDAMYGAVYPVGSGAPEEMFYRGFLQNEFYEMTGSAYAAIPLSSAAFMFSHTADTYLGAGTLGLYLGTLTFLEKGRLSKSIAVHFWNDVIAGALAIATLNRNSYSASVHPVYFSFGTEFQ